MLTAQAKSGTHAWRGATIDAPSSWYYRLSPGAWQCLARAAADARSGPRPVTDLRSGDYRLDEAAQELRPVLVALEAGRGFAIIDGAPVDACTPDEAQALYWLIGQLLGRPFEQNVQGTLLYDVRDTGQKLEAGARFSVTNYETSFHTDNPFGSEVLDYVGLFCVRAAKTGGLNQVVSGYTVCEELRRLHPDVLETLQQPFHFDRRAGVRPGEAPTACHAVLAWQGDGLLIRYLRYWIKAGHEKVGQPLTPLQLHALDMLDQQLARRDLAAEFALRRGQMFFINNRWIVHNRSAFEDYPELERRRHLVRLWLKGRSSP